MSRPEPRRNSRGEYLLPDPETGVERSWVRTTTLAKSLSDTTALDKWSKRQVLLGIKKRPELLEVVGDGDDRDVLNSIAEAALKASGSRNAAQAGTDLHKLTELVDLYQLRLTDVPKDQRGDVRAYVTTLAQAGIDVLPEYIERVVINRQINAAGTYDRILRLPDGRLAVGDLKTGRNLRWSWLDIAMQLSIYANAEAMWNDETQMYEPLPPVDLGVAIVMHLPIGEARMTIHEVDIAAGWEAARLAHTVQRWRSRYDLNTPVDPTTYQAHGALFRSINAAESVEALEALWSNYIDQWTHRHTAAAAARKAHFAHAQPLSVQNAA